VGGDSRARRILYLAFEIFKADGSPGSVLPLEGDPFPPDIDADHLFGAGRGAEHLPLARETTPGLEVHLMFVHETAHQPTAPAGDLGRIEGELLVFCQLERYRLELGEPG
jgi:hypothetical protein